MIVALLQMIALLALPVVAIALIVVGLAGRRDLTRPVCAGCRAPMTFAQLDCDGACERCNLTPSTRAPRCERRRLWITPLITGLALIGLSVALVAASIMLRRATSMRPTTLSNAQMLAGQLTFGRSAYGAEIRRRLEDGTMTVAEVTAALSAHFDPNSLKPGSEGTRDLTAAVLSREANPKLAKLVLENGFRQLAIWPAGLTTPSPILQVDPTTMNSDAEPLVRVVVLRSFQVNDQERSLSDVLDPRVATPLLPLPIKALPSGNQDVLIGIETLLYERFDAERLRGPDGAPLLESDWPKPLARSTTSLGLRLTVP